VRSLYIPSGLYLILLIVLFGISFQMNNGHFISPLDDTYIHLAIAKNLSLHGIWGITQFEFSGSSSSLLWTILLAGLFKVFGVVEWIPFVLNILFGFAILLFSWRILEGYKIPLQVRLLLLTLILFITPLPPMTLIGMEHLLHALLTLGFVYWGVESLKKGIFDWKIGLLSLVLVSVRYESLFLIGSLGLLFWINRKFIWGVIIGAAGLIPIISYAIISLSQGWMIAPNSILVKGNLPENLVDWLWSLLIGIFWVLPKSPGLFALVILLGISFFYCKKDLEYIPFKIVNLLTIFLYKRDYTATSYTFIILVTIYLHSVFADVGWLNRYEAYLVPIGLIAVGINISNINWDWLKISIKEQRVVSGFVIFSLIISLLRVSNIGMLPTYSNQIYIQQYQMGKFVEEYYNGKVNGEGIYEGDVIGLNDIGWVSYLGKSKLVDIWGLGHLETGKMWVEKRQDIEEIDRILRKEGTDLILVYDAWLSNEKVPWHPGMPEIKGEIDKNGNVVEDGWIKIAEWRVEHIFQLGDNVVSFYVFDQQKGVELRGNLREFEERLPNTVTVLYY